MLHELEKNLPCLEANTNKLAGKCVPDQVIFCGSFTIFPATLLNRFIGARRFYGRRSKK
jgi:hypothetical protein